MANEQKITEIWDIAALEAQKAKVIDMMKQTVSEMEKANAVKISFSGDAKSIGEATKITSEYNKQYEKTIQLTGQLNNLKSTEGQIEEKLQQAQKESIKNQKLQAQATNDLSGAWERARAKGQLLDKQARDLGFSMYELEKAGKKGTAEYQKLEAEFNKVSKEAFEFNAEIKKVDAGINIHSKNVGNYGGAITSLRQEIKNLTQTLATMEMQGKNNSKEYKTMVMRLGELKDAVGDVQARSKFFADDARYLNTVTQAVQGVVGAYSVWVGASELLGTKNEELEKIMRKMMALMTIMQGLSQVQKMLDKDSYVRVAAGLALDKLKVFWKGLTTKAITSETIVTEINTAATVANTTALEGQAVAAKSAGGAFGLIVAGAVAAIAFLGTLAYSLINFNKNQLKAKEDTEEWKRANDELNTSLLNTQTRLSKSISVIADYILSLRQRGKSQQELNKEMINTAKIDAENLALAYERRAQEKKLQADNLKDQIDAINARKVYSKENEGLTLNEIGELNRLQNAYALKMKDVKSDNEAAKTTRKLTEQQIIAAENLIKKEEEAAKQREKDLNSKYKQTKATIKYAAGIERIQKILPKQVDATVSYYEKLQELNKELQTGLITQKEYNAAYSELNGVYIETIDNTEKLTKAQMDLNNEIRAAKSTELNKLYEEVPRLAGQGLDLIQSYSDLMSINNDNELKEYEKLQDEKLRILNDRLNLGLITEAQYTAQKSNLDLEYDKKKEELEKKEFKRKKALAIAEAVINAASGVIKALGEGSILGIIQAGVIGAMAALEIAKINAQYPTYAKGRDGGKAETAIVGEHGFEYISTDTGLFKTPNHATLTYLPAGASVIPHEKSLKIENYLNTPHIYSEKQNESKGNKELLNELKKLNSKPNTSINIDKHGFAVMMAKGGSYVNFVNDHIRIKH